MLPDFEAGVRAIVETVAIREGASADEAGAGEAANFILASFRGMPAYLRPPLRAATIAFDAWPLARRGRPFHALRAEQRVRQLEAWEASRIGGARMLMTFYVSLALFGLGEGAGRSR